MKTGGYTALDLLHHMSGAERKEAPWCTDYSSLCDLKYQMVTPSDSIGFFVVSLLFWRVRTQIYI
jgi:hypothetical protein